MSISPRSWGFKYLNVWNSSKQEGILWWKVKFIIVKKKKNPARVLTLRTTDWKHKFQTCTPFKPTSPGNFPGKSLHILRAGRPGKVLEHLSDRPQFPRGSCHGYESPESLVRCTGSNRAASERGFRLRHAQLRNFGVKQWRVNIVTWK